MRRRGKRSGVVGSDRPISIGCTSRTRFGETIGFRVSTRTGATVGGRLWRVFLGGFARIGLPIRKEPVDRASSGAAPRRPGADAVSCAAASPIHDAVAALPMRSPVNIAAGIDHWTVTGRFQVSREASPPRGRRNVDFLPLVKRLTDG